MMADCVVGLTQLVQYSDSSSEEDGKTSVRVVDVKEKHSKRIHRSAEQEDMSQMNQSKRSRLDLPSAMLTMFTDSDDEDPRDDCSQHQGRTRTFAHARGHWATYVYFPVEVDPLMATLVTDLLDALPPSDTGWVRMPALHVSVSRTVIVFHHWITDLMDGLGTALRAHEQFDCYMGTVELYTNDDKTRTFFGLRVSTGHPELESIVGTVDRCLAEYQLEGYYKNPSFHVSMAWTLGDVSTTVTQQQMDTLQEMLTSHIILNPRLGILDTRQVEAKCGNKIFSFTLKES